MKLIRAKKGYRKVGDKYLLAKKCTKCGKWKVASTVNFHKSKKGKFELASECKECYKSRIRAKNNPVNTNSSITKVCITCGKEFPATEEYFHKHKNGKYGLETQCKECKAEYRRQYYQKHKDKEIEYAIQWQKDNSDKALEYHRQWRKDNKDRAVEYHRQWRKDNPDKVAEYHRQWRKDNPDKVAEYSRQYYENNKDKVLEKSRQYYQEHKDKVAENNRQWRKDNPDKVAEYSKRQNKKRRQARIDAIIAQKRAEYEAERAPLVAEKTCKCCGRTLPASEFYVNKKSKDHLQSYCKECNNKKRMEKYYHDLETKGWA